MATKIYFLPISCIFFLLFFVLPVFSHVNNTHKSPFGFIKDIQGCHKGDKVKGIHNLKLYLSHFGYLNNPNVTNPRDQDDFDDELEAAIKSYQAFYHLNSTGTLDAPTVSMMVKPRCGFPDKKTGHQHSDASLHTVSHYTFFPNRPKWPAGKRHLTYAFGSGFPASFMAPVASAFSKWASATQYFTFSRTIAYQNADLKIRFARQDHGDGAPFDGPGGVLAHAFAPTVGLFHFDADNIWAVGAVPNAYDVESVALHEIGHLLGLDHSQYQNAIMWSTFQSGETKGLNTDDIQGVWALYGTS
ncbi:hypothetical protein R6Q59_015087 [Mikania micrantha]|uniref:Peptidase metallopeptidase domain-containing protein n=1 Tax=Mikania micrantha TaxID=192012 RepID=A0A5N6PEI2_9ASTR|nr:hypothetical protein E3N88_07799 [Mikania micrantha]